MAIGEAVWIDFPIGAGRAQAGRRPAVILQSEWASKQLSTVLAIPLTSQIAALRFPGTVLIEPNDANGLTKPSVALVFQLSAIDRRNVGASIGTISASLVDELLAALHQVIHGDDSAHD